MSDTEESNPPRKSQRQTKPSKRKGSPDPEGSRTKKHQKQHSVLKDQLAAKRTTVSQSARKKSQKNQGPIAAAFEKARSSKTLETRSKGRAASIAAAIENRSSAVLDTDTKDNSAASSSSSTSSSSNGQSDSNTNSSCSSEPLVADSILNTSSAVSPIPASVVTQATPGTLSVIQLEPGSSAKLVQQEKKTHTTPAASSEAWEFFFKIKVPNQEREHIVCHVCKQVREHDVRLPGLRVHWIDIYDVGAHQETLLSANSASGCKSEEP